MLLGQCEQRNHRITTQMQRRIYGHATDVEIRPLDEEKAVQAAVDLIGELFIFAVVLISFSSFHTLCFFVNSQSPVPFHQLRIVYVKLG